jgi:hypothetical protein
MGQGASHPLETFVAFTAALGQGACGPPGPVAAPLVPRYAIGVGMAITGHPLHRPGRAELPHPVPASRQTVVEAPTWAGLMAVPVRCFTSMLGTVSELVLSWTGSAWPAAFPPAPPPLVAEPCSGPSSVLRSCMTSQPRASAACGLGLPAAVRRPYIGGAARTSLGSPGSRARCFRACPGSPTPWGPCPARARARQDVAFRIRRRRRHPRLADFGAQYPACTYPY